MNSGAQMRVMVKRLLKKYKYPPAGADKALETVMRQCEHWADAEEIIEAPVVAMNTQVTAYHLDRNKPDYSMVADDNESYKD